MTFLEKYNEEKTWFGKVIVMEIYHLTMTHRLKNWTITATAEQFGCSTGLVSENLRLAQAIHFDSKVIEIPSRNEALRKIKVENGW